jgi:cytochrome c oxidase subunit II
MPTPAAEQGWDTLLLWQGSWIAALLVGAVVWGLILWSVIFHRRSRHANDVPPQTRYNVPIEVLYTVVPFIIIAVLFFYTARNESRLVKLEDGKPRETINIVGRQWSWTFNYLDGNVWDAGTPGQRPTLVLPKGERVRFELSSPDVIHSFWIPAFLFKMDIIPGVDNKFELTPSKEGTFAGKCAELCGVDHARMLFDVKVVSPEAYQAHLRTLAQRKQTGMVPGEIPAPEKPSRVDTKEVTGADT